MLSLSLARTRDEQVVARRCFSPRSNEARWGRCGGDAGWCGEAVARQLAPACSTELAGVAATHGGDGDGLAFPANERPHDHVSEMRMNTGVY